MYEYSGRCAKRNRLAHRRRNLIAKDLYFSKTKRHIYISFNFCLPYVQYNQAKHEPNALGDGDYWIHKRAIATTTIQSRGIGLAKKIKTKIFNYTKEKYP